MLKNKYVLFILFCLAFGSLGLFREYFFGNYNNVMYMLYNRESTVPVEENFRFFLGLSYKTAYYLKYVFSILFVALFFVISVLFLRTFSSDKKLLKWLSYSYLVLLLLSMVLMLSAYFIRVNLESDEYSVSRWLMGIAQSPLPALFLLATAKLNEELRIKN